VDDRNDIYCDEEGLLKPIDCGFQWGENQPLAGKGLILGFSQDTGDSQDCTLSLDAVKGQIKMFSTGAAFRNGGMEWAQKYE
jgi:hypothetical protein